MLRSRHAKNKKKKQSGADESGASSASSTIATAFAHLLLSSFTQRNHLAVWGGVDSKEVKTYVIRRLLVRCLYMGMWPAARL